MNRCSIACLAPTNTKGLKSYETVRYTVKVAELNKSVSNKVNPIQSCKPNEKTENYASFISCDLQDFKFYYVNCKVFGERFLY